MNGILESSRKGSAAAIMSKLKGDSYAKYNKSSHGMGDKQN